MSFGYGVGDAVLLLQLAWKTLQATHKACGEHDELTREVSSLHRVLKRLQRELDDSESLLNRSGDDRRQELREVGDGCTTLLNVLNSILEKYNALPEEKRSGRKLWQKIRFGNGEMQDLSEIRLKLSTHTSAILMMVNLCSLGSQGRVETQLNNVGGELEGIRGKVDWIAANMTARSAEGTMSVWTSYADDDRALWRELRSELNKEGYDRSVLHKHRRLIKKYVQELGERGLFDQVEGENELDEETEAEKGNKVEEETSNKAQFDGKGVSNDEDTHGDVQVQAKQVSPELADKIEDVAIDAATEGVQPEKADAPSPSTIPVRPAGNNSVLSASVEESDFDPESVELADNLISEEDDPNNWKPFWRSRRSRQPAVDEDQKIADTKTNDDQDSDTLASMIISDESSEQNSKSPSSSLVDSGSTLNKERAALRTAQQAAMGFGPPNSQNGLDGSAGMSATDTQSVNSVTTPDATSVVQEEIEESKGNAEKISAVPLHDQQNDKVELIRFKDAVGRKYSFPFNKIRTWAGIEESIKQAFLHVEKLRPHVMDGHYDLVGPNGEIILPLHWEELVRPDWAVSMHMWPIPEPQPPASPGHRLMSRQGYRGGPPPPPSPGGIPISALKSSPSARGSGLPPPPPPGFVPISALKSSPSARGSELPPPPPPGFLPISALKSSPDARGSGPPPPPPGQLGRSATFATNASDRPRVVYVEDEGPWSKRPSEAPKGGILNWMAGAPKKPEPAKGSLAWIAGAAKPTKSTGKRKK